MLVGSRFRMIRWSRGRRVSAPRGRARYLAIVGLVLLLGGAAGRSLALPLTVTTSAFPDGTIGVSFEDSVVAANGVRPWNWSIVAGALPAGLSLDATNGTIDGTPSATGTAHFIVLATDAVSDTATRALAITIAGVPSPVTDLVATRLPSGNDADGTAKIQLAWTPTAFAASAKVYRAAFGGYPRYDDAGGLAPPTPSYPPGAPWVLTAVNASGQTDEPLTRDAWSYVVFAMNSAGVPASVSNQTAPTPNYALGDVSNGSTPGLGDNQVNDADISLLGSHYGISGSAITGIGVSFLDVGPTVDFSPSSRPFTDNRIDFEDLLVFASNYGQVSSPAAIVARANAADRSATDPERVWLETPAHVEPGEAFSVVVHVQGAGRMQGLSARLAWDASVAEPVAVVSAGWLEAQRGVVLSPAAACVDAALLGVRDQASRGGGISGAGSLATVTFRARTSGDPAIRFARVLARDAANRPIPASALELGARGAAPARTLLLAPAPNPSAAGASLGFSLARAGEVELAVYSVAGSRVRVLARGPLAAGTYHYVWTGEDDARRQVTPGIYYVQLAIRGGPRIARAIVRVP